MTRDDYYAIVIKDHRPFTPHNPTATIVSLPVIDDDDDRFIISSDHSQSTARIDPPAAMAAAAAADVIDGGDECLKSTATIDSAAAAAEDGDDAMGRSPPKICDESEENLSMTVGSGVGGDASDEDSSEWRGADDPHRIDGMMLSPTVLLSYGIFPSNPNPSMERSRSLDAGLLHIINSHNKNGISNGGRISGHIVTSSDRSELTGSDRSELTGSDRSTLTSLNRSASESSSRSHKRTETYEEFMRRIEQTMRNPNYKYDRDDGEDAGGIFLSGVLEETESFTMREFGPSGAPNYMDLRNSANHDNRHHHQSSTTSSTTTTTTTTTTRGGGGARGPLGGIVVSVVRHHRPPRAHNVSIIDVFLWPFRKIRNGYMGCMWIVDDTAPPWRFA